MTEPAARPLADLYLRLSDLRNEQQLDGREAVLRAEAERLGWEVHRVIVENDETPGANGNGRSRPASAFKRTKIRLPSGQVALRTVRPGFRSMLDDLTGRVVTAILAEDLDRLLRQPRDGEDLLDAVEMSGATARSLSGSLTLTEGGTDDQRFMARIMAATANKASADTARRVSNARQRLAGRSYHGGKRPFGHRPDPDAPQYARTLIVVEAEAEVIRQAADAILDKDISLKALARKLREDRVPTVTGAAWTPSTLRDVLLKPAVAGLAVDPATRELIGAPWPHILNRDTWERLRAKLTDPGRTTSPGNEPRWLVSKIARCGCGSTVRVNGVRAGRAAYVCDAGGHLKRAAARVDELVERRMIWRLSQPDIQAEGLLMPPPVPGAADPAGLDTELRELGRRRAEQMDLHSDGIITKADLARGMRDISDRTAAIKARLAAARRADPLPEFRDRPADVVWDALPVARKRAVIRLLADITFKPVAPSGPVFNEDSVAITWKA
jgi:site-specific DNA recombinase